MLSCSFSSVGISFARILKWGKSPVIETFVSFKFLKIILIIVTRFLVQSYILAMAVKSLMFKFVSRNEYFKPGHQSTKLYEDLGNLYYRGLCRPFDKRNFTNTVEFFCSNEGPEILTFDQATLYMPLCLICILYLPSIIYVLKINISIFGLKALWEKFFENPVLFLFPLFTSFSFHKIVQETRKEIFEMKKNRRNSLPSSFHKTVKDAETEMSERKRTRRRNSLPSSGKKNLLSLEVLSSNDWQGTRQSKTNKILSHAFTRSFTI